MADPMPVARPSLPRTARWAAVVAALPFAFSFAFTFTLPAGADRLAAWLNGAFLLSLALLFIAIVMLAFVLEGQYRRSAAGGGGTVVLGGGFVLTLLLAYPLVRLALPQLEALRYDRAPAQAAACLAVWAVLLAYNAWRASAGRSAADGALRGLVLLAPTGLAALWLIALGKALWLFGAAPHASAWKAWVLLIFNGIYEAGLAVAAAMIWRVGGTRTGAA